MTTRAKKKAPRRKSSSTGAGAAGVTARHLEALREVLRISEVRDRLEARSTTEHLLNRVLEAAVRALGTEEGSITELDTKKGDLFFRAAHSVHRDALMELRVPISEGVLGYVARSGQALCVQDVREDERFDRTIDEATGYTTESLMAAPILVGDKVIGVIELVNLLGDEEVTQGDLSVLGNFAQISALILVEERERKGTLAFIKKALTLEEVPEGDDSLELAGTVLKSLSSFRSDPTFRRSLKLAALVRAIARRGGREALLVEEILISCVDFFEP